MKTFEAKGLEVDLIEEALNFYWNDATFKLENIKLGDRERQIYEEQRDQCIKLITKIESL